VSAPDVRVYATGTANTASVLAAFRRLGAAPRLEDDPRALRRAPFVVLPGVGSFGAAALRLAHEQRVALRRRVEAGRPTLAICLGLQLLALGSDESPGARGLALIPEHVRRFPAGPRCPLLGWKAVEPEAGCRLVQPGWAYFAHGYRLEDAPAPWSRASAEHGGRYVAALELGSVLACQFHPELSGAYGKDLLTRWLAEAS
jgi:imidazole glycerol phosphate synthase glutamine amidotransferase subunit